MGSQLAATIYPKHTKHAAINLLNRTATAIPMTLSSTPSSAWKVGRSSPRYDDWEGDAVATQYGLCKNTFDSAQFFK